MALLRGTLVPRVLLGLSGLMLVSVVWISLQRLADDGPSLDPILLLLFSGPLALLCFLVAFDRARFRIRE